MKKREIEDFLNNNFIILWNINERYMINDAISFF